MRDWVWQPYFPPQVVITAGMVLALLAVFAYARTWRGAPATSAGLALMRLVLLAGVVVLLLGPSRMPESSLQSGRSTLKILMDHSRSMQTRDMDGQARYDFALTHWLSEEQLARLQQDYEIELFAFGQSLRASSQHALQGSADERATDGTTHLAAAVEQALAREAGRDEGDALLVISDGRDSDDASFAPAASLAEAHSMAVHAVPLGGADLQRDMVLAARPTQSYLFAGEPGSIQVELLQTNLADATTVLHFRGGGSRDQRELRFDGRSRLELELPIVQEEPGLYEYELFAEPIEGELETSNNRQRLFVEVTAQRLRVLLLEGQPYWDTKFLAQSLRRDERVALTQVSQVTADRQQRIVTRSGDTQAELPRTLEDLARYDVVILGRGMEHVIDEQLAALLPRYVGEHGGRLVLARGRPYDPETSVGRAIGQAMAAVEPVVWGNGMQLDQKLTLADAGYEHPSMTLAGEPSAVRAMIEALPALARVAEVRREKTPARVLARTLLRDSGRKTGRPAIVAMPYQRGMVLGVLGEGLWKWSLHGRRNERFAGVFDRFWSNSVRWLSMGNDFQPGSKLALRLSRRTLHLGETLNIELASRVPRDPSGRLVVMREGSEAQRRELAMREIDVGTRWQASLRPEAGGVHTVRFEPTDDEFELIEQKFSVIDIDRERLHTAANPAALRQLAEQTGGALLDPYKPEALTQALMHHRAALEISSQPEYLWDRGWLLVVLLMWAGAEWVLRKKGGLL